eukprot:11171573-Alexandrium_andersonii.AAC.1
MHPGRLWAAVLQYWFLVVRRGCSIAVLVFSGPSGLQYCSIDSGQVLRRSPSVKMAGLQDHLCSWRHSREFTAAAL